MRSRQYAKIKRRVRLRLIDGMDPERVEELKNEELARLEAGERPYRAPSR